MSYIVKDGGTKNVGVPQCSFICQLLSMSAASVPSSPRIDHMARIAALMAAS